MHDPQLNDSEHYRRPSEREPAAPGRVRILAALPGRLKILLALVVALAACFALPLWSLIRFSWHSELYSHILLIPFISVYLVWLSRRVLFLDSKPAPRLCVLPLAMGVGALVIYWLARHAGWKLGRDDCLALTTFAFLSFLVAGGFLTLGIRTLRQVAFPIFLLVFTIPFPAAVLSRIEILLQHGSADVAQAFFWLAGMPVARSGVQFGLPGFSLEVGMECCGIHSTLVLLITSLLAGYLFLRSVTRRCLLALIVIPLALLRNGFRIFVIGELCVNVNPNMIDSPIHHQGGPIFFALSLVPFCLILLLLRKSENRKLCISSSDVSRHA